ncbi:MAG: YegP family protein [Acidimicrobiia bacterium]
MIELRGDHHWTDGHADGVVRDIRRPLPDDGLLPGAVFSLGDAAAGPSVMLTIEGRRFPKKAPTHLHKTDTFRMALGEPIVVGRTSYPHGRFRLQAVDTYYGPEYWNDETGTNQLLIMADRRGGKPYLTTPELQALSDMGRSAEEELGEGFRQHRREADVPHVITNNLGVALHAGHFDAGFDDTSSWPRLSDGTRLAVIAMGNPASGCLFLCWDRPAGAAPIPAFVAGTDLLRVVVEGSLILEGDTELPRLGFRLQQEGALHAASHPGQDGVKELWLVADRRAWRGGGLASTLIDEVATHVDAVIEAAKAQPAPRAVRRVLDDAKTTATSKATDAIEFHLRRSDDDLEPFYVSITEPGDGRVIAFTDTSDDRAVLEQAIDALRIGDDITAPELYDRANDKWFYRLVGPAREVLFRSMPCASQDTAHADVERVRNNAPDAVIVDETEPG